MEAPEVPYLPQELVDQILDHLHDDSSTLLNCALVSRTWLPTSRMHLFSKIRLLVPPSRNSLHEDDTPRHGPCQRLHDLLTGSPEIIPYIHDLRIHSGSPNSPASLDESSWVLTEDTLPPLLLMLTDLRHFEFTTEVSMPWDILPITLRQAIDSIFQLDSLTFVRLRSWAFSDLSNFASLFAQCRNLKGLSLRSVRLGPDDIDSISTLSHPDSELESSISVPNGPRLEFLTLDDVDFPHLGDWLLSHRSAIKLTHLRELRISHPNDRSLERLLRSLSGSLQHLHLKLAGPTGLQPLDLSHNAGLRSIRLTLEQDHHAVPWVTNLLSSIPAPNLLERVAIEIYMDPKKLEGWEGINNVLADSELCSLCQVEIGVFAPPSHAEFLKVEEDLVALKSKGVLHVYQLGTKSRRMCMAMTPVICSYDD